LSEEKWHSLYRSAIIAISFIVGCAPTSEANVIGMSTAKQPQNQYWYNGQLIVGDQVSLPIQDPGLLFGATVFTTLRVYEHHLDHPWTAWPSHIQRLESSLRAFHWASPNWEKIRQGAEALAREYSVLRVTLFPDGRELILGRSLPPQLSTWQAAGITAWVATGQAYQRSLPHHKTGNYLSCWLALQAAKRTSAQEAILLNAQGHWLETSTGNLWGWADGQWYTPPLDGGILPGVLRSRLLQGLQSHDHALHITPWITTQVNQFSYIAYSNSVIEIVPYAQCCKATRL
jgi:branched-subunit amino acid aminotransferase/4-amino-4-deoxychorismate lyase